MNTTDNAYIWGEVMVSFIGFHGTNLNDARTIERTNFRVSKSGWLGKGAYFFENDRVMAEGWANYRQRGKRVTVLECMIELDQGKIFDISHPSNPDTADFFDARDELLQIMVDNKIDLNEVKKELDGKVIDYVCAKKGKLLVRALTYTYQPIDRQYKLSSWINNGIELCVRHAGIIKNKKII